jgi:hypothetical protein
MERTMNDIMKDELGAPKVGRASWLLVVQPTQNWHDQCLTDGTFRRRSFAVWSANIVASIFQDTAVWKRLRCHEVFTG